MNPRISIIMGSDSDYEIMKPAYELLTFFDITFETDVVSAHRTPQKLYDFALNAHKRKIEVIIAGAGGAAHLPGMVASISPLPVIGVPIKSSNSLDGWDSILSILQMPNGVPVATVALNASKNAAILAVQILASNDPPLIQKILTYKEKMSADVTQKALNLKGKIN